MFLIQVYALAINVQVAFGPPIERGYPEVTLGTSSDRPTDGQVVSYETAIRSTCGPNSLEARFQQREPRARAGYFKTTATRLVVRQGSRVVFSDPSGLRDMTQASLISARPTCEGDVLGLELLLAPHDEDEPIIWRSFQFKDGAVSYFRKERVGLTSRLRYAVPRDRSRKPE